MKTALIFALVAIVVVAAHPEGKGHRRCPDDDYECQCGKLMKPARRPSRETMGAMRETMKRCLNGTEIDLGAIAGGRRGGGRHGGKHQLKEIIENNPEAADCILTQMLTNEGSMSEDGTINSEAFNSFITDNISANQPDDVSDDQVTAITNEIEPCVVEAQANDLPAYTLHQCMKDACVTALSSTTAKK